MNGRQPEALRVSRARIGASVSPFFVGLMFARPALWNLPFFFAGTLKIVYDVVLYRQFVAARPPEER